MTLGDAFYVLFCTYVGLLPSGRSYWQILNLYAICEFVLPSELEPSVNLLNLVFPDTGCTRFPISLCIGLCFRTGGVEMWPIYREATWGALNAPTT